MVIRYTGVVTYNICTHCTPKFYPFTFVGFTLNNLLGGDPFRRVIFKDVARKHFGKKYFTRFNVLLFNWHRYN